MQGLRALLALVLGLGLPALIASASPQGPSIEPLVPLEGYTITGGPDCTYVVTIILESPLEGNITILRNGLADITGLAQVEVAGNKVVIDTRRVPALSLGPGDYHEILVDGQKVAIVRCPGQEETFTGQVHEPPGTNGAAETWGPVKTLPPPRVEKREGAPEYKGFLHLIISATAGAAAIVTAVREHGRHS